MANSPCGCTKQRKFDDNTSCTIVFKLHHLSHEKIELEDLFISDLKKILDEIKFYLWWEANVQYPKVKAEYEQLYAMHLKYQKMKIDLKYDPQVDDDELMSMKKMAIVMQKDE